MITTQKFSIISNITNLSDGVVRFLLVLLRLHSVAAMVLYLALYIPWSWPRHRQTLLRPVAMDLIITVAFRPRCMDHVP